MTLKEMIGDPTDRDLRIFGTLQLPFFAALCHWVLSIPELWFAVVMVVSTLVAVVALIKPQAIRPVYTIWMVAVFPIGWAISHFCMAMVYYLVVTPIGFWRRTMYGDPLQRQFDSQRESYWEEHHTATPSKNYFRQF